VGSGEGRKEAEAQLGKAQRQESGLAASAGANHRTPQDLHVTTSDRVVRSQIINVEGAGVGPEADSTLR
jgi:hypothetical protein